MRAAAPPSDSGSWPGSAARRGPSSTSLRVTMGCKAWARSNPPARPVPRAVGLLSTAVLRPSLEAAGLAAVRRHSRPGGPRMISSAHQAAQLDTVALARYLEDRLPGFKGPITAEKTPTGQSNPTFVLASPSGATCCARSRPGSS